MAPLNMRRADCIDCLNYLLKCLKILKSNANLCFGFIGIGTIWIIPLPVMSYIYLLFVMQGPESEDIIEAGYTYIDKATGGGGKNHV